MLAIEHFERAVALYPHRVFVIDGDHEITYSQMDRLASSVAWALAANGIAKGTRVGLVSPNHPNILACQYGILRAGAVYVPGNYRNTVEDTRNQFEAFGVEWLFYHSDLDSYIASLIAQLPKVRGAIALDEGGSAERSLRLWTEAHPEPMPLPLCAADDVIYIGATGGTSSSQIKGVVHTNRSWESSIASFHAVNKLDKPPVHIVVAPLSHAANVFHWCLLGYGPTNVICPSARPDDILGTIERHKGSYIFLPPTIIYMLLAHPDIASYDLSSLDHMVFGSSPMSVEKLKEAISVFGPILEQMFGSSETLNVVTFMSRTETAEAASNPRLAHRLASAGRSTPLTRVSIMDDAGNHLPAGERGEIVVRSASVMKEYFNDPERTAASRVHGWHHTNDIGYLDDDGYLYLVDRKNDMIISGSFNIYPGEIEQVVLSHPAVRDCAVIGAPHEKWGEEVVAAIELKPGVAFDEGEFISFCKKKLGSLRAPKRVEVWEQMPRSPVGKTLRRKVRERYWQSEPPGRLIH